jgi:hypothetical protein
MVLAQGKSRRLKAGLGGPNQKDEERCFVWPVCMAARLVKLAFREGFTMRVRASVLMTAAAMIAGPARAEFVTGNDLYTPDDAQPPSSIPRRDGSRGGVSLQTLMRRSYILALRDWLPARIVAN